MRFAQKLSWTRRAASVVLAAIAFVLLAPDTRADIVLSFQPDPVPATQGSTGNTFTVVATNIGSSVMLDSFNVTLSVPAASGITFTGGDDSVPNYVFAGNSLGFLFNNPSGPETADISDLALVPPTLMNGDTVSLGRLFFDVASDAPPGPVMIFVEPATSFTDENLNPINYSVSEATIPSIQVNAIPEPGTVTLFAVGGLALAGVRRSRMKQKSA